MDQSYSSSLGDCKRTYPNGMQIDQGFSYLRVSFGLSFDLARYRSHTGVVLVGRVAIHVRESCMRLLRCLLTKWREVFFLLS